VTFLGSPAAYAARSSCVERIETHFSWVFLTDHYVYKLKKPLRAEGFDFSSLMPGGAMPRRKCVSIVAWPAMCTSAWCR
jgi:aminoglycoside phosphotransferase family enzyme